MSDHDLIQGEELPLSDELIVSFLEDNPDFFNRNLSLITSLRINDAQRGTVSLVERQQQQLRHKIHNLEEEITQLMSVANHNEQLFGLYSDIYLRLLDCDSASELVECLFKATTELLSLSDLKLWLSDNSEFEHENLVSEDCSEIMNSRLTKDDYYFGRLQQSEQQQLFAQETTGSVVLVKLAFEEKTLGFLAISSEDAEHFDPRMDTLLLSQFRKLVAKLLHQHLS